MNNIEKVNNYLQDAGVFYLATIGEGERPKCRPLSFHMLEGGRLYFGVGAFKQVYAQMQKNDKVEICACQGGEFLRYYGKARFVEDAALVEKAKEVLPMLRDIYNETTGYTLGLFYLEDATAEFRDMLAVKERIDF